MPAPRRDNSAVRFDPLAWSGDRWDFLTNIILAIVAVVLVSTFTDYPITYDEEAKAYHGDLVRAWIASGFSDQRVFDFDNLNLYGSFFDLIASVSRLLVGDYLGRQEASHLLIAAFGFLGVFATARVGRLAAGPMVGCLSCLLLIFTPQFYGHLFSNPKDMPFAALTMASIWAMLRFVEPLPRVRGKRTVLTGVVIGLALGIRVGGVLLWAYLVIVWALRLVQVRTHLVPHHWIPPTAHLLAIVLVSYFTMLLFWPWAAVDPLRRPFIALREMQHFSWNGDVLFDGLVVNARHLPRRYFPTYLAITTPALFLFFLLISPLSRLVAKQEVRALPLIIVVIAAIAPPTIAIAAHSTLYNGLRHLLFVLPPLAILQAIGLRAILGIITSWKGRSLVTTGVCAYLAVVFLDMHALHPYQYLYYNRIFGGGLRYAASHYETDYWGMAYTEGIDWVANVTYPPKDVHYVSFAEGAITYYERWKFGTRLQMEGDPALADYWIDSPRHQDPAIPWPIVKTIERDGVPLLIIRRNPDRR